MTKNNPPNDGSGPEEITLMVEKAIKAAQVPNTRVYHIAVYGVILIAVAIVLGSITIILVQKETAAIPEFFAVALGTALGAIAGMLMQSD